MTIEKGDAILVERDLVVGARDGVGLAMDVYRPAQGGPFPVLLERTPYDKSAPSRSERTHAVAAPRSRAEVAAYFVRHGYAVIYQDCRGRYQSGGHFTKYLSEAEDGYDTLAWLMRQPWCNGRIGTFGLSYAAHTQAALGCLDPPGLAAQF
ncbi:MAG TPA: CocE/NonD family hydrolase, partial [Stellaceae bacterium]|nr:CocE/NonD family hydrolase [Stellaceae bacterium]